MKHSATAQWKGTGKEGAGRVSTQSGVIKNKNMISEAGLRMAHIPTRKNWWLLLMPVVFL